MQNIDIISSKSSGLAPAFTNIQAIDIEDAGFATGAFGALYHCIAIDKNAPVEKIVIKIFQDDGSGSDKRGYETILKLQEKVFLYNEGLKQKQEKTIDQVSALYALPQLSFTGKLGSQKVYGYASYFLDAQAWLQFSDIFNEPDKNKKQKLLNSFYHLPVLTRLQCAFDLVEAFYHLSQMGFIYADLNPQNFFVNKAEAKLCLIDFDGGAIDAEPETFGKMGEWLAPEIQSQLTVNAQVIKVTPETDRWAVMVGIHFMLFPHHPLFYLKVRSIKTMLHYFSSNRWPDVDKKESNFNKKAKNAYDNYLPALKNEVHPSLVKLFTISINKGYNNPLQRPSYQEWMRTIGALLEAPVIEMFQADRPVILNSMPAVLRWKVNKALAVYLNGSTDVTGRAFMEFLPDKNTSYTLRAVGRFGDAEAVAHVTVLSLPVLETLRLPMPYFDKSINLSHINISRLYIEISLQGLDFNLFPPFGSSQTAVHAGNATNAQHSAPTGNPWTVSGIFDKLKFSFTKIINSL